MRKYIAIQSAKLASSTGKLFRLSGTAMPGLVAEKIDSNLLSKLRKNNFPKGVIVVTGTNGKTTTSKIIADVLKRSSISFVRNTAGSNLRRGVIATILAHSNSKGRCKEDMAVFEVDEAYIPSVCRDLKPDYLVVTNLFRDQLDRYGELDSIANNFRNTFKDLQSTLILNADDPLVASLGRESKKDVVYFGVNEYIGEKIEHDYTADSVFDINTGKKLKYTQRYFSHIGIYRSKNTQNSRPKPQITLSRMHQISKNGSKIDVKTPTEVLKINLKLPGLYNIYNALAVIGVANIVNIKTKALIETLNNSTPAFGRGEELTYSKRQIELILIKNPTGFNQVIQTYLKPKPQTQPLLICINDHLADGRDVSWLWDSAIEDISSYKAKIVVSGSRAYDMALRLKYAGISIDQISIEPNIEKALDKLIELTPRDNTAYILPTYTAMMIIRKEIAKKSNGSIRGISS